MENESGDRLRVSADLRFQPAADRFDERWVNSSPQQRPGRPGRPTMHVREVAVTRTHEEALREWGLAPRLFEKACELLPVL